MTIEVAHSQIRGWESITLSSPELRLQVIPGLGASIVSLVRVADGIELLHQTPWGLPNAATGALPGSAAEVRHDFNPGGWQSLFPNAGDNAIVDGIEWGTDGEARLSPFDVVIEQTSEEARLIMTTRLRRTPFRLTKIIRLRGPEIGLTETIEHCGHRSMRVLWASQLALGSPLISGATEIDCGAAVVHPDAVLNYDVDYADISPWPRTPGPDSMINLRYLPEPGSELNRLAYLTEFSSGWATVTNREIDCNRRGDGRSEARDQPRRQRRQGRAE